LELARWSRFIGLHPRDQVAITFLDRAAEAFAELQLTPELALLSGRLKAAFELLGRLPLIGQQVAEAVTPAISTKALEELLSPHFSWVYRALAQVTDERLLHRVVLRLLQAQLPLYAQIRHGPIEYGKDIAVLVETSDGLILRLYQVKVGDISKATWPSIKQ
jgi:hypothetical protein